MGWKDRLVGRKVTAVYRGREGGSNVYGAEADALKFEFSEGDPLYLMCEGDCCSYTWIEHMSNVPALIGTVTSVESKDMPDPPNCDACDVVIAYGTLISTDRGSCEIEYRNASNGYYGGGITEYEVEGMDLGKWKPLKEDF